jgi:hypothetical protein
MASQPSQTMRGRTAKAAIGSALKAALPVVADRRRFSFASHGMTTAATTRMAIPRNVVLGSLYPRRLVTEKGQQRQPAQRAMFLQDGLPAFPRLHMCSGAKSRQHYYCREKFNCAIAFCRMRAARSSYQSYGEEVPALVVHPARIDVLSICLHDLCTECARPSQRSIRVGVRAERSLFCRRCMALAGLHSRVSSPQQAQWMILFGASS